MSARSLITGALATLLACSCSVPRPRAPARAIQASDFEAAIARLQEKHPGSPALLSAKLAYAQFLLSKAPGPCAQRLNLAQEQLGSVAANRETRLMYPDGWALVANLEYEQHLGRAACGSGVDRRDELLAATEAARHAVELYRNEFDYHAMVVMQFDAAIALHRLGEQATGRAALEQALRMDREYGFAEDARENYKLLLTWRGEPPAGAELAHFMRDFPQREATLQFGWHPVRAKITIAGRRATLDGGRLAHSDAAAAFERRIAAASEGGWSVTYAHRLASYQPGVWASAAVSKKPLVFPPAPLVVANFKVSGKGEFTGVTDAKAFSRQLTARTAELIRAAAPPGDASRKAMENAVEQTALDFSPGMLEADAAQNYELETAMWIGATLKQGVWYQVSAPMSLAGVSQLVVEQQIEFAFTRRVPCTAGSAAKQCVEIVIHITPDPKALAHVLADIGGSPPEGLFTDYFVSTEVRIVTDPATLLPYAREERVFWYAALGKRVENRVLESEHLISTTSYPEEELSLGADGG